MSASDGSGDGGGSLIPVFLGRQQLETLRRFLSNPFRFVASLISLYVVGVVFELGEIAVGAVLYAFNTVVGAFRGVLYGTEPTPTAPAIPGLLDIFGAVGVDILGALVGVQQAVGGVVAVAGPFGPVIAVGSASLLIYAVYVFGRRLAVGLIGELPGGSTLLELFGVD